MKKGASKSLTKPVGATASTSRPDPCPQPAVCPPVFFPAVVLPQGDGSFLVKPGKPVVGEHWVSTKEAMKIVGLSSRGTMHELRNSPGLCEMLRWKYLTPGQGRIVYEVSSLWAYRRAMEDVGK